MAAESKKLAGREAQLEAIKAAFPQPATGKVTERSDAVTQRYFRKYQRQADSFDLDGLAEQVLGMREDVHNDLIELNIMISNRERTFDAETRAAARRNIAWLQQRVGPWLTKVTQFQRGR